MKTKTVRIPQEMYKHFSKKAREMGLPSAAMYLRIILKDYLKKEEEGSFKEVTTNDW